MPRVPLTEEEKAERRQKRAETARLRAEESALLEAQNELYRRRMAKLECEKWLPKTLRVVNMGLLDVLASSAHYRARNWVATVEVNPMLPGGLQRFWWKRGRGVAKYIVPDSLEVGSILEFGADDYTSLGKRYAHRVYALVLDVTKDGIYVQPHKTVEGVLKALQRSEPYSGDGE